jgi:O-acetylhomoserine/O-acetylserine sulfhydrylase-like pyridoxal-dependent enzyme
MSDLPADIDSINHVGMAVRDLGAATTPFNAFMAIQGLETLPLRMERHCANAVKVAAAAKVGTLVMFHHDPTRTDDALDDLVKLVKKHRKATIAAKEGLQIKL